MRGPGNVRLDVKVVIWAQLLYPICLGLTVGQFIQPSEPSFAVWLWAARRVPLRQGRHGRKRSALALADGFPCRQGLKTRRWLIALAEPLSVHLLVASSQMATMGRLTEGALMWCFTTLHKPPVKAGPQEVMKMATAADG